MIVCNTFKYFGKNCGRIEIGHFRVETNLKNLKNLEESGK